MLAHVSFEEGQHRALLGREAQQGAGPQQVWGQEGGDDQVLRLQPSVPGAASAQCTRAGGAPATAHSVHAAVAGSWLLTGAQAHAQACSSLQHGCCRLCCSRTGEQAMPCASALQLRPMQADPDGAAWLLWHLGWIVACVALDQVGPALSRPVLVPEVLRVVVRVEG